MTEDRPVRQRRPQEKLNRIIAGAIPIFSEQGYTRASIQAICHAAGVSVGTFYSHFDDKADLMLFLAERAFEEVQPPALASVRYLKEHVRVLMASSVSGLTRAWVEASALEPRLAHAQARLRRANVERYTEWIREARSAAPAHWRLDDLTAARAVIALLKEAITQKTETAAERIDQCANAVWLIVYGEATRSGEDEAELDQSDERPMKTRSRGAVKTVPLASRK